MNANWSGTDEQLRRRLEELPSLLDHRGGRLATLLARAIGVEMLTIVKEAFVEKGRGGTDAAGISWAPLSPAYVAYHRRHKGLQGRRSRAAKAGRSARPLLTAQQDRLWKSVYASCLRRGDDEATAARKAWGVVKQAGGKTVLEAYGNEKVEIGRDTGRLLASLSPGGGDNLLDANPGVVRVGTNVSYAMHFHKRRPMWPEDPGKFPQVWLERLATVFAEFVRRAIEEGR